MQDLTTRDKEILEILGLDLEKLQKLSNTDRDKLFCKSYQKYLIKFDKRTAAAHTLPLIISSNSDSVVEHEATTGKISEANLYYLQSRGLSEAQATSLIVSGYCRDILSNLPFEFAVEAKGLLELKIEGF